MYHRLASNLNPQLLECWDYRCVSHIHLTFSLLLGNSWAILYTMGRKTNQEADVQS